jgi:hypothetical protein
VKIYAAVDVETSNIATLLLTPVVLVISRFTSEKSIVVWCAAYVFRPNGLYCLVIYRNFRRMDAHTCQ